MLRKGFSYAILLVTLLWLIFSYVPASILALPQIAYPQMGDGTLFRALLAGGFVLFVLLQVWLVIASVRMFRTAEGQKNEVAFQLGLTPRSEALWTAIPLLMSIGLAFAGWGLWSTLAIR